MPKWQGAKDFEDSLMNGGELETDYDVICGSLAENLSLSVITRHDRDMLGWWDSENAGCLLPPELFSLPSDAIVLSHGLNLGDESADALLKMQERVAERNPDCSLPFNVLDSSLRFQPAVDYLDPESEYDYVDITVAPGHKRGDLYTVLILGEPVHDVVVISPAEPAG